MRCILEIEYLKENLVYLSSLADYSLKGVVLVTVILVLVTSCVLVLSYSIYD